MSTNRRLSRARSLTRREALKRGGRAALKAGALGLGAATLGAGGLLLPPAEVHAIDWSALFRKRMPDVSGTVRTIEGMAYVENRPLHLGDTVPSGALVRVAEDGRIVIGLADGGIFTVYGGSELELFLEKMSQGVLNLLAGALLMVAPKGSRYLIAGSDATFGIKGTVVYRKVVTAKERMMYGPGASMEIPAGATGYFCTCNGAVDFLHGTNTGEGRTLTPFHESLATHHNAQFLVPGAAGARVSAPRIHTAPMLGHTDQEISALVGMQDPAHRHPIDWLRPM